MQFLNRPNWETQMQTYRAVIVGLTGIGARRPLEPTGLPLYGAVPGSHAAAYHRHPQTEVVGVCDIRQEALDGFQKDWRDIWPDMHYYTDYKEMLEVEKPDLVSVATPTTSTPTSPSTLPAVEQRPFSARSRSPLPSMMSIA